MCLFKVRQEEEVVVPYRVHRPRSPSPRRRSTQRISRTEVIRESRPQSSTYIVPAPQKHYPAIPAPQPVPVFVQPPPPRPASSHRGAAPQYVEVSPRSSVTSASHSDYVIEEREVRRERREYSPRRRTPSPQFETFRYIDPPEQRYAPRERSRSRDRRSYADDRGIVRETRERVLIVDDDGRRRREYRR